MNSHIPRRSPPLVASNAAPPPRRTMRKAPSPHLTVDMWIYVPLIIAVILRMASESTANLSYPILAAYALLGPSHAIRALALVWLLSMISPGLAPEASSGALGRILVLFAATASAVFHRTAIVSGGVRAITIGTLVLGLFIVIHSFFYSAIVDVSVFKAVLWTLAAASLLSLWSALQPPERRFVASQLFWGLVMVLVLSLPLIKSPIGYLRNGTGFQGILSHPQTFGPAMGILCAWSMARLLAAPRPPLWLIGVTALSAFGILLSEARTAGLAMALAIILAMLTGKMLSSRRLLDMMPALRSARTWFFFGSLLLVSVVMAPLLAERFNTFINKSNRVQVGSVIEAYEVSRGGKITAMVDNIREHPLTGIGFGIASDPGRMVVERDDTFNLPVSAAIEKGITVLAVLEELGIIGASFVAIWLYFIVRSAARGGFEPFSVSLTVLMLNFGEATLFSPGGNGLLGLILLSWGYASGIPQRNRRNV